MRVTLFRTLAHALVCALVHALFLALVRALVHALIRAPPFFTASFASQEIRTGVNLATGIPEGNVLMGASHTHAGPDLQGLWGFVSDAYRTQVINAAVDAISEAFFRRESSRLLLSKGTGFANNRRGWGYTDDELTVLDVQSLASGRRTGTIIQFAAVGY